MRQIRQARIFAEHMELAKKILYIKGSSHNVEVQEMYDSNTAVDSIRFHYAGEPVDLDAFEEAIRLNEF